MNPVDRIGAALGLQTDTVWKIVGTIAVFLLWVGLGRLARRVIARAMDDSAARFQMTRVSGYVLGFAALVVVAKTWMFGPEGYFTVGPSLCTFWFTEKRWKVLRRKSNSTPPPATFAGS